MADKSLEGHRRSRSSVALAMLHRDKSKHDKPQHLTVDTMSNDDPIHVDPESVGSTPPTSTKPRPAKLIKRSLSQGRSSTGVADSAKMSSEPAESEFAAGSDDNAGTVSPTTRGVTIEQSVRMFRLFEALRSGDTAAITKALKSTSSRPGPDGSRRGSESSSNSATGGSGPLEGTTILHLAIQCADVPIVEFILTIAASQPGIDLDINARDRDGNTPLHLSAALGRTLLVQTLLDQGNINDAIPNHKGRLPIDLARTPDIHQQLQVARSVYLDAKVKEMRQLVATRDYDALEDLLQDSRVESLLDLNETELATDPTTTEAGGTLLHEAARHRDLRLIEILLFNGADPFRRDHKGKLPQDVTKDDKTRAMLKKSPAAAAAQRGIQEKAILGGAISNITLLSGPGTANEGVVISQAGREMKGYLKKWTNYTSGYKMRWFVLEDGVLSYYKHQDDAGSACRGAINMRIAKLFMDAQDKQRFWILGKSSVKYHLKANHEAEAKRWYWALNNAIQWAKDEAKAELGKRKGSPSMPGHHARKGSTSKHVRKSYEGGSESHSTLIGSRDSPGGRLLAPGAHLAGGPNTAPTSVFVEGEDETEGFPAMEPSLSGGNGRVVGHSHGGHTEGEDEDDGDYHDDASALEAPATKDAFNITAHSAKLQLDLLGQVSGALQHVAAAQPETQLADERVGLALTSYDGAVQSLKVLLGDLLRIAKDRDAYWQHRLDREADVRRMWEDSMTRVAEEQEALESQIGESERRRKRTKRALRSAMEEKEASSQATRPRSRETSPTPAVIVDGEDQIRVQGRGHPPLDREASGQPVGRSKSRLAEMEDLADSASDDEEFFDAIADGEVEVMDAMPESVPSLPEKAESAAEKSLREAKQAELTPSYQGYEDPPRTRLKLDADNRPKVGLWGILKSMIGKDMTKMTLPVSFNEPTNLLHRVAEDMEYTHLLDTASDRLDATERLVYVAAFAASGYASTIGRVAKPFNPLLGETYEYVRPDKGIRFLMEQVSHHPPIGAAYAESARWDYFGESAVKSKFYGKSFEFNPLGTWFLRLRPASGGEELYTWKKVTSSVVGIITNNPTVDNYGPMIVKNWASGEVCHLDFKARGWKASSAYQVQGQITSADGQTTKWSLGGHWNDKIYARPGHGDASSSIPPTTLSPSLSSPSSTSTSTQAILIWQANPRPTGIPFNLTPFAVTLNALPPSLRPYLPPTDSRFRPDQRAMEDGEYDYAATEKTRVEEKQRAKRRERESKGEEFAPRWFRRGREAITGEEYWEFDGGYWKERRRVGECVDGTVEKEDLKQEEEDVHVVVAESQDGKEQERVTSWERVEDIF